MSTKEVIIELDIIYKLFFNFLSSMFKERKDWLLWTFSRLNMRNSWFVML